MKATLSNPSLFTATTSQGFGQSALAALKSFGVRLLHAMQDSRRRMAAAERDRQMWAIAKGDHRIMAELQSAMTRAQTNR